MIFYFFINDTATTEIYTLSLHDALPISNVENLPKIKLSQWTKSQLPIQIKQLRRNKINRENSTALFFEIIDRKSTRLNSSHANISYAVFCLKKKTIHRMLFSVVHQKSIQ